MSAALRGGDRLIRKLQEMAQARGKVRAGILENATNHETGEPIAPYAAVNEFGGTINIPARQQTLYFKQNRDGTVGTRFVGKEASNFAQDVTIPAHSVTIPPRPFMRNTIQREKDVWTRDLGKLLMDGMPVSEALRKIGARMADDIGKTIDNQMDIKDNAPSTKRRKERAVSGGAKGETHTPGPLVDTGSLRGSIWYEVEV